jgi:hypothetical protein
MYTERSTTCYGRSGRCCISREDDFYHVKCEFLDSPRLNFTCSRDIYTMFCSVWVSRPTRPRMTAITPSTNSASMAI